MLKGPVHPTNTAGVWEKKCTVIQKNWRCLALKVSVVTLEILKFIPGSVLVAISWMISKSWQHGELQEINNIPGKFRADMQMTASFLFQFHYLSSSLPMWRKLRLDCFLFWLSCSFVFLWVQELQLSRWRRSMNDK